MGIYSRKLCLAGLASLSMWLTAFSLRFWWYMQHHDIHLGAFNSDDNHAAFESIGIFGDGDSVSVDTLTHSTLNQVLDGDFTVLKTSEADQHSNDGQNTNPESPSGTGGNARDDEIKNDGNNSQSNDFIHAFGFEVSGHVQGVYFRKHTRATALSLGLTGWVQNTNHSTVIGQVQAFPVLSGALPTISPSNNEVGSNAHNPTVETEREKFGTSFNRTLLQDENLLKFQDWLEHTGSPRSVIRRADFHPITHVTISKMKLSPDQENRLGNEPVFKIIREPHQREH